MEVAIKINHLNKYFGKRQILHDVSFEAYAGEVFGFLGPNGAGKTTTIKMIVGMLGIDEGDITICGVNMKDDFEGAMKNIGAIVENPEAYKYMSGLDNLRQYARMRPGVTEERIKEVIEFVGLNNRIKDKVGKYSLGMRQRLGVAQALLHKPKVLILDEPTNGLDPAGIKNLRDILKNLAHNEGVCVLVSSHLMSEMELMCDRVGIIANGSLIDVKTLDQLILDANGADTHYLIHVDNAEKAAEIIQTKTNFSKVETNYITILDQSNLELSLSSQVQDCVRISEVNQALILNGITLHTTSLKESKKLEDAFIEMTSEGGSQIA